MLRRLSIASVLTFAFFLLPVPSHAATVEYRDLVKLPDDGNVSTQVDSTVYYVADDGRRYVYPNDRIYFSWRIDYSKVKVISASQMAQIPIGGNVLYRPGVRLVKVQSDPKIYAVEPKGSLRWVKDGETAVALYGQNWTKRVDDLSDAFFGDYKVGAPLESAIFPTGSVVKAAGSTYYVEGSTKRRIASDSVLSGLRYRPTDVLTALDLTTYADGATLGTPEPDLTDDAQLGLVYVPPVQPVSRANFEVSLYPSTAVDAVRGEKEVSFANFELKASSAAPNVVASIAFQGRLDEGQGDSDFGLGLDNDDGSQTFLKDVVPSISLYAQDGTKLAGPFSVGIDGRVIASGLSIEIPGGTSRVIVLKGDVPATAPVDSGPDLVAFDIENVATDIAVTAAGADVPRTGAHPNNGAAPIVAVPIREKGTLTFKWVGYVGHLVAGRLKEEIGYIEVKTSYDAYELQKFSLQTIGNLTSLEKWIIEYPKADGTTGTVEAPYFGATTTFEGLSIPLVKNGYTTLRVWAKMKPKTAAQLNEEVKVDMVTTAPLRFVSKASGAIFTETSHGFGDFTLSSRSSSLYVRYTLIAASRAADSPSGALPRGSNVPVLKFGVRAEPEGDARLVKLVFKITPGDAETAGSPNDALEKWAVIDGDVNKDEHVVNLYRTNGPSPNLLGEETFTKIDYSVVHFGVRDDTPAGIISAKNDYGLITYEFDLGDEPIIAAGTTADFTLQLDTTVFALNSHNLKIELLGGFDLAWTDASGSGYTPITGLEIPGFPLTSAALTVNP